MHRSLPTRRRIVRVALGLALAVVAGTDRAAAAGPSPDGATGYDVGWPQCGKPLPPASGLAIVQVNDGHSWNGVAGVQKNFAANPCLGVEWSWGQSSPNPPSAYIILDFPHDQNTGENPYTYGVQTANAAISFASANGVHPAMWWLDVETSMCWQGGTPCGSGYDPNGSQVVHGAIDAMRAQEQIVGVYSTPLQWGMIAGGYTPGVPVWNADYNDPPAQAYLGCTANYGFTGGDVWVVQSNPASTGGRFDPDYSCPSRHGYYLVAGDGGIFPFGSAVGYGSTGGIRLNKPVVGMAATPDGHGYWVVASDGGIFPFGDAGGYGSTGATRLNQPIVGMAPTRSGHGYWLVASDGGIFPFGDAGGYGSTGNIRLNQPIVGMAPSPTGHGYWLVASDGGIFPFGDAGGYGSTGAVHLNRPIVGMAATPDGRGYWLVASDGGIFPFGDAAGYGSAGGSRIDSPVVGMALTHDGGGYWLVTQRGGVLPYGDAVSQAYGTTLGLRLNKPVLQIAATS